MLVFWLSLSFSILIAELYLPFRSGEFINAAVSAFFASLVCSFGARIYIQSAVFALVFLSLFIARTVLANNLPSRKKQGIALCDIREDGRVYYRGNEYPAVNIYPVPVVCGEKVEIRRITNGVAYVCHSECKE